MSYGHTGISCFSQSCQSDKPSWSFSCLVSNLQIMNLPQLQETKCSQVFTICLFCFVWSWHNLLQTHTFLLFIFFYFLNLLSSSFKAILLYRHVTSKIKEINSNNSFNLNRWLKNNGLKWLVKRCKTIFLKGRARS